MGKTYCFTLKENPNEIVTAFSVANDSIKTSLLTSGPKRRLTKSLPQEKRFLAFPSVLIGRLGVNKQFQGSGVGSDIMWFIKGWFSDFKNKTGCRCILVDAYANIDAIKYYTKNGFQFLFNDIETEKKYLGYSKEEDPSTRLMYFDLITMLDQEETSTPLESVPDENNQAQSATESESE